MKCAVILTALIVAVIRPFLLFYDIGQHAQSSYEAIAHLLVGGLIGVWAVTRLRFSIFDVVGSLLMAFAIPEHRWEIRTASALTVIEIVCAAVGVAMKRGLL